MALDVTPLLIDHAARQYNLTQVAEIYDGETEDGIEVGDLSADKTTAKADIHTAVDNENTALGILKTNAIASIKAGIDATSATGPEKAALKDQVDDDFAMVVYNATTVKGQCDTAVDAMPDGGTGSKKAILESIKTELDVVVAADAVNFPYQCVWCQGAGRYEANRDTGADPDDTTLKHCDPCDGFGRVQEQQQMVIVKPSDVTYP